MRCPTGFVLMISAVTVSATEPEPTFRWRRSVEVPTITETTLVAMPLDAHVHHATRDGWPDVRLRAGNGDAVAFMLRPATTVIDRTVREFWPAQQTAAKFDAERGLQVELSLGEKDPLPTGVQIVSPLRDFDHQVQVESSADGQTWQPAGESALIFDYTRFVDARNVAVPLAGGTHRRFRLTIADVTAEQESQLLELHRRLRGGEETERSERTAIARRPFRIDRVEFYRDVSRPQSAEPRTTETVVRDLEIVEDSEEQRTLISFATDREPVTAVRVITSSENFSRPVAVEVETERESDRHEWTPTAKGTITRFAIGALRKDELTIAIPATRRTRYRVVIDNADSPPLVVTDVAASGPIYELSFLAAPNERYELEYGSPDADPGRYDTAALQAAINERQSATTTRLGMPTENPNAPTARRWVPWNDSRVLIGGIVLMTVLLGYVLYAVGRDIKNASESPPKPPQ